MTALNHESIISAGGTKRRRQTGLRGPNEAYTIAARPVHIHESSRLLRAQENPDPALENPHFRFPTPSNHYDARLFVFPSGIHRRLLRMPPGRRPLRTTPGSMPIARPPSVLGLFRTHQRSTASYPLILFSRFTSRKFRVRYSLG